VDALRIPWTERTAMPTARGDHGAVAVNNVVYVAGGSDASASLATLESYDTARDLWRTRAPMATARESFALVAVDGVLYAIGGVQRPSGTHLASVERYDPATDTWTPRAPMSTPRFGPAAGVIGGKIYVAGGSGTATAEVYDPASDRWTAVRSMSGVRTQPGCAVANGRLYVFGGSDGVASRKDGEMYDPVSNQWVARAGTGGFAGLERFGVARIGSRMIRSSGFDSGGEYYFPGGDYPAVAQYDFVANQWTEAFLSCPFPARGAAMVTVGDRVYWIGGIAYHAGRDRVTAFRGVRTYKPE
jgi:N-acetylneuraminic acid mutarotase